MELWPAEIDAMRPEARAAVSEGMALVQEMLGGGEAPAGDPMERLHAMRDRPWGTGLSDQAVDRQIAGVRCRTFVPDGPARAVYLHFHGGGMVAGVPEMNDLGNQSLCEQFDLAVVSVDYRLAPEHPFPAGPDDGVAVASWLLDHAADEYGSARLLVGGESAGGYMSAAVLLRLRDELGAVDRVDGANLVFGVYDWGRSPSQRGLRPHEGPDLLDPAGIEFFTECYLPGRTAEERRDPAVSPAYADLTGLPPALFSVGTCDHLVDDTLMLAPRWAAAGNGSELFVAPDMPHGFMAFPCGITNAWFARTVAWFGEVLDRPPRAD
jgi:acetyl esterase